MCVRMGQSIAPPAGRIANGNHAPAHRLTVSSDRAWFSLRRHCMRACGQHVDCDTFGSSLRIRATRAFSVMITQSDSARLSPLHLVIVWVLTMLVTALGLAPISSAEPPCVPGPDRSLVGCDFSGDYLTNANLTNANLTNANLTNAILVSAILTGARLSGVDLRTADLTGVRSGGIEYLPALLPDPWRIVGGYLIGPSANLASADLTGANLTGADLTGANLTGANLTNANLTGANLTNANLTGANMAYANLTDANLFGANLTGVRSGDISGTPLPLPANWSVINGFLVGPGANLTVANFEGRDLTDVDLSGANLTDANLINANLRRAVLINANLTGADLPGAILTGATLTGATFSNAQIYQTTFGPSGDAFKFTDTSEYARSGPLSVEGYAGTLPNPSIPEAVIGRSVTGISVDAFRGTTISSINLGSVQTVAQSAFQGVGTLTGDLAIPDSVVEIERLAFYETVGFNGRLTIGTGTTSIGDNAFNGSGFTSLVMRGGVSIGDFAFARTSLTDVTFPASLRTIGAQAFADRVTAADPAEPVVGGTFTFNGPAPTIEPGAFAGAQDLIVRYPEGAAGWPMSPDPFGTGARQIAVPRPPTPAPTPEPTTEPASNPNPMASSTAGAQPAQSTVGTPVPVPTVLRPGAGSLVIDGVSVPVTIADSGDGRTMTLSGAGVTMTVDARGPNGRPIALAPDGSLVLARGGSVPVVGSGFSPGSTVVLYLFSSPRQLISVKADATGAISTSADVPRDMPTGRHTLQIAGSTSTGQPLNLSVGLRVETPAAALGSRPRIAVPRTQVKVGDRIPITVTGAQPRCTAQLRIKGDDSAVRLSAAGRGSGVLHAPSKPGTWVVTARIKGPGCSPVVVRQAITASK